VHVPRRRVRTFNVSNTTSGIQRHINNLSIRVDFEVLKSNSETRIGCYLGSFWRRQQTYDATGNDFWHIELEKRGFGNAETHKDIILDICDLKCM
jgi:hypothetical protein